MFFAYFAWINTLFSLIRSCYCSLQVHFRILSQCTWEWSNILESLRWKPFPLLCVDVKKKKLETGAYIWWSRYIWLSPFDVENYFFSFAAERGVLVQHWTVWKKCTCCTQSTLRCVLVSRFSSLGDIKAKKGGGQKHTILEMGHDSSVVFLGSKSFCTVKLHAIISCNFLAAKL